MISRLVAVVVHLQCTLTSTDILRYIFYGGVRENVMQVTKAGYRSPILRHRSVDVEGGTDNDF